MLVQPVPTGACIVCTTTLAKQEGRKLFLEAKVTDLEGNDHYTDGTALFINLRESADTIVKPSEKQPLNDLRAKGDPETWHEGPRYDSLVKGIGFD